MSQLMCSAASDKAAAPWCILQWEQGCLVPPLLTYSRWFSVHTKGSIWTYSRFICFFPAGNQIQVDWAVKFRTLPAFEVGTIWTVSERWNMVHVIDKNRQRNPQTTQISIFCRGAVIDLHVTWVCNASWPRLPSGKASSSAFLALSVSLCMGWCQLRPRCHVTIHSLSKSRWVQPALSQWPTHCLSTSGSCCLYFSLSSCFWLLCKSRSLSSKVSPVEFRVNYYLHWFKYQMPVILLCQLLFILCVNIFKTCIHCRCFQSMLYFFYHWKENSRIWKYSPSKVILWPPCI